MKSSKTFFDFNVNTERPKGVKTISWSQFAMYGQCPHHWKLNYGLGLREFRQSIHTIFGTAFHETLQHYLDIMYNDSIKKADEMDCNKMLLEQMFTLYKEAIQEMNGHFSTKEELNEFYFDGVAILDWFKKKRGGYFSTKGYQLVGIEMPIMFPASDVNSSIYMNGFIDLVIRDTVQDKIIVYDIKTSTKGWNKYQKSDKWKANQLVLYKSYFAKQYGFPEDKIDIKYFIVKRKLIEGFAYPQKRIQEFVPASGKPTRNKLQRDIDLFIQNSFNDDGSYNLENNFLPIAGKNGKNCRWCEWKDDHDRCPVQKRIKE